MERQDSRWGCPKSSSRVCRLGLGAALLRRLSPVLGRPGSQFDAALFEVLPKSHHHPCRGSGGRSRQCVRYCSPSNCVAASASTQDGSLPLSPPTCADCCPRTGQFGFQKADSLKKHPRRGCGRVLESLCLLQRRDLLRPTAKSRQGET